jgi:hypothetical protein
MFEETGGGDVVGAALGMSRLGVGGVEGSCGGGCGGCGWWFLLSLKRSESDLPSC